jgi:hypothetical protein
MDCWAVHPRQAVSAAVGVRDADSAQNACAGGHVCRERNFFCHEIRSSDPACPDRQRLACGVPSLKSCVRASSPVPAGQRGGSAPSKIPAPRRSSRSSAGNRAPSRLAAQRHRCCAGPRPSGEVPHASVAAAVVVAASAAHVPSRARRVSRAIVEELLAGEHRRTQFLRRHRLQRCNQRLRSIGPSSISAVRS